MRMAKREGSGQGEKYCRRARMPPTFRREGLHSAPEMFRHRFAIHQRLRLLLRLRNDRLTAPDGGLDPEV